VGSVTSRERCRAIAARLDRGDLSVLGEQDAFIRKHRDGIWLERACARDLEKAGSGRDPDDPDFRACAACSGTGMIGDEVCEHCSGTGNRNYTEPEYKTDEKFEDPDDPDEPDDDTDTGEEGDENDDSDFDDDETWPPRGISRRTWY
jgi:hypothetical protein